MTEPTGTLPLADAHCHIDFAADPVSFAQEADAAGLALFDCGVDPRAFDAARARDAAHPGIIAGLGLHPWWIAQSRCGQAEVDLLCALACTARFIGEVGLDYSPRFAGSEQAQAVAFEALCRALATHPLPGRALSIHAVRSAGVALDILERTGLLGGAPASPAIIFHWFSGTSAEFTRTRQAGCYFSVNERTLASRRGREYARQITLDRLLLETDLPQNEGADTGIAGIRASLERAAMSITELKHIEVSQVAHATRINWERIVSRAQSRP